jgi:hypothetical protein
MSTRSTIEHKEAIPLLPPKYSLFQSHGRHKDGARSLDKHADSLSELR